MNKALQMLREIKSVSFSTVRDGSPRSRIIDVMLVKGDELIFVTARGKAFYNELEKQPEVAITGYNSEYKMIRVQGKVKQIDQSMLEEVAEANPMIKDLYPGDSIYVLEVFSLYEGVGEILDLSGHPPKRERISFGGADIIPSGYRITDQCIACGKCLPICPMKAISEGDIYKIDPVTCIECGRCYEICPVNAIEKAPGL